MITMFEHEGPCIVNGVHELPVGILEHLNITPWSDVDIRVNFIDCILKGAALKKFTVLLPTFKENIALEVGGNWTLV